jgi:REP element-mobilizing transposase RayT
MSVRRAIGKKEGIYFITLTCCRWLHLFELANSYDVVYTWFDYLKSNGHYIAGYVIMPNHLHALIAFRNTSGKSINATVGNGKRFMAYEIVKLLKQQNNIQILNQLSSFVNKTDKDRGKLHEVFEPSFDWKECLSDDFIEQKLNYIHENPNKGEWKLVEDVSDYPHSSAKYYFTGEQGLYQVTSYMVLKDVDLTR